METTLLLLVAVIMVALAFDVTNGMHDTANSVGAWLLIVHGFRRARRRTAERSLRRAQIGAAGLQAFAHGTNDAQKTMGVIALALIAAGGGAGSTDEFAVPFWVVLACATSLTIGTLAGGWRIIGTMSRGIARLDVAQGVAATAAGGIVLLLASRAGLPVSTTYASVGSIMGAGATRGTRRVRWQIGGEIAVAWAITVPCAALVAMLCSAIVSLSPLVLTIAVLALLTWMLRRNHADGNTRAMRAATPALAPAIVLARDAHERGVAAGAAPWWQSAGRPTRHARQPAGATVT